MWYLYIIKRNDRLLYTGITKDVQRRFKEHQLKTKLNDICSDSKFLYQEAFEDKFQAAKREKQIKGWTRKKKLALIKGGLSLLKKL